MKLHHRSKTTTVAVLALLVSLVAANAQVARAVTSSDEATAPSGGTAEASSGSSTRVAFAELPLRFEPNQGQTDPLVRFVARGRGHTVFLTPSEAVVAISRLTDEGNVVTSDVVRMRMLGANEASAIEGSERLAGVSSYFRGSDPADWTTGVPGYGRVTYRDVYRGVDLVYRSDEGGRIEYDFVVSPGVDPSMISLAFDSGRHLRLDETGDLVIEAGGGELRHLKPVLYQEVDGQREGVAGGYLLGPDGRVRFEVGSYDTALPLVIDPVLVSSTYLGGSGNDQALGVAVDSSGSTYVAGSTTSIDFPVSAGPLPDGGTTCGQDEKCDPAPTGVDPNGPKVTSPDAFVTKLSADGSTLLYSAYIGGSRHDSAVGIAVDAAGSAYVTGRTESAEFPTTPNAFDRKCGTDATADCDFRLTDKTSDHPLAGETKADVFLTKLAADGSALTYSTYLGGSGDDARPVGTTYAASAQNPTQPGDEDASASGPHPGAAGGIVVDDTGNAYVTGSTLSHDFPTTADALDRTCGSDGKCDRFFFGDGITTTRGVTCPCRDQTDAFVATIATTNTGNPGASLAYSTYLGGEWGDAGFGIDVRLNGPQQMHDIYIAGFTASATFPTTANAFQTSIPSGPRPSFRCDSCETARSVPFVTRLNPAGSPTSTGNPNDALVYATFLGGTGVSDSLSGTAFAIKETAFAIAVDNAGMAYVTGQTDKLDFPTKAPPGKQPLQEQKRGPEIQPTTDVFVSKVDTNVDSTLPLQERRMRSLVFSTYFGSRKGETEADSGVDAGRAIVVDELGRAIIAGRTAVGKDRSDDLPTKDPVWQRPSRELNSTDHAFVAAFGPDGSSLVFSTMLGGDRPSPGGDGKTHARGIGLWQDPSSGSTKVTAAGHTAADNFPMVNASQAVHEGYSDGFVARIELGAPATPFVTGVHPQSGSSAGGTEVAIQGSGLVGTTAVYFGGLPAQQVTVQGSTVKAVSPPGGGTVDITVATPAGTSPPGSAARFTYFDGRWEPVPPSPVGRNGQTATVLLGTSEQCGDNCGKVLLVGGRGAEAERSAHLHDPGAEGQESGGSPWSDATCVTRGSAGADRGATCPATRFDHTATLMLDGTVLVAGGDSGTPAGLATAQIYSPKSDVWTDAGSLNVGRRGHTATLLVGPNCGTNCGKVLVVGGGPGDDQPLSLLEEDPTTRTAELYDPSSKTWQLIEGPVDRRVDGHTATLITGPNCGGNCGKVFVVGGRLSRAGTPEAVGSAELYDPALGAWTARRAGIIPRYFHAATVLTNGKVMLSGGLMGLGPQPGSSTEVNRDPPTGATEIFDPAKELEQPPEPVDQEDSFTVSGGLLTPRSQHKGVGLPDGRAFVTGGSGALAEPEQPHSSRRRPLADAELHAPGDLSVQGTWRNGGMMATARQAGHTATLLTGPRCGRDCGKVLVIGGTADVTSPGSLDSVELYTPGPYISSVAPNGGSPAGGDIVTIGGSGFVEGATTVRFDDAVAEIVALTPTEIVVKTPAMVDAPKVAVSVLVPDLGLATAPTRFTYAGAIGAVDDLVAKAVSAQEVLLTFSATGSPPANEYVVKQSRSPIDEGNFDAGRDVCEGGVCRFVPAGYRDALTVSVGGLVPETTYFYAVRARGPDGALGPLSNVASTVTGNVSPGAVTDLRAVAVNDDEVRLEFAAPGSNGVDPPPARRYVVKQSEAPIVDAQAFEEASTLCDGVCVLEPANVGDRLQLGVSGLQRETTYHYALRALDEAGNSGPISNSASSTPGCVAVEAGPSQLVYSPGYQLVGLPSGTRVPAQSVLYGWFNLGRGGRYATQSSDEPVAGGRGYWAWFSCPRLVNVGAGASAASSPLAASSASMVGNPSGTGAAVVSGHDFTARWDPLANSGRGGYQISGYRQEQTLAVGEGVWAFSYRDTTLVVRAQ